MNDFIYALPKIFMHYHMFLHDITYGKAYPMMEIHTNFICHPSARRTAYSKNLLYLLVTT